MNDYYVYIYLNIFKPGEYLYNHSFGKGWVYEPFYVGKGKGVRKYDHIKEAEKLEDLPIQKGNRIKLGMIKKILKQSYNIPILIVEEHLTSAEAFAIEKDVIKVFGRRDLKTGCLSNMTDGGDGCINYSNHWSRGKTKTTNERLKEFSDRMKVSNPSFKETTEQRRLRCLKASSSGKGIKRPKNKEYREKIKYGVLSYYENNPESRKKLSECTSKQMTSKENRERCVTVQNIYEITTVEGGRYIISNLKKFCSDRGFPAFKLRCSLYTQASYKGYSCKIIVKFKRFIKKELITNFVFDD